MGGQGEDVLPRGADVVDAGRLPGGVVGGEDQPCLFIAALAAAPVRLAPYLLCLGCQGGVGWVGVVGTDYAGGIDRGGIAAGEDAWLRGAVEDGDGR